MVRLRPNPPSPDQRWCPKCSTFKQRTDFWKNSTVSDGLCAACKSCMQDQAKSNRAAMRHRASRVYGLTLEEYDELKSKSETCPICGETTDLHLDHNEELKKIREFICGKCNRGLGMFGHNVHVLASAIAYLEKHSE